MGRNCISASDLSFSSARRWRCSDYVLEDRSGLYRPAMLPPGCIPPTIDLPSTEAGARSGA